MKTSFTTKYSGPSYLNISKNDTSRSTNIKNNPQLGLAPGARNVAGLHGLNRRTKSAPVLQIFLLSPKKDEQLLKLYLIDSSLSGCKNCPKL